MSFQKKITHRKNFDQKIFFRQKYFRKNIFWKNFFFEKLFSKKNIFGTKNFLNFDPLIALSSWACFPFECNFVKHFWCQGYLTDLTWKRQSDRLWKVYPTRDGLIELGWAAGSPFVAGSPSMEFQNINKICDISRMMMSVWTCHRHVVCLVACRAFRVSFFSCKISKPDCIFCDK